MYSSLLNVYSNRLENAWWCKQIDMNNNINELNAKNASPIKILKQISPKYPINVCWSHGKLISSEKYEQ